MGIPSHITLYNPQIPVRSGNLTEPQALGIVQALHQFIVKNDLVAKGSNLAERPVDMSLVIIFGDVNDDGLKVFRLKFDNYLARFDRNIEADPFDVRLLEKALAAVRKK